MSWSEAQQGRNFDRTDISPALYKFWQEKIQINVWLPLAVRGETVSVWRKVLWSDETKTFYFWPTNEALTNTAHQPERNMAVAASQEASQSWLLSPLEAINKKSHFLSIAHLCTAMRWFIMLNPIKHRTCRTVICYCKALYSVKQSSMNPLNNRKFRLTCYFRFKFILPL